MNITGTVKFVGGLIIGAGCNTMVNRLIKPAMDGLNGFQKFTAGCAVAAFSGYIGAKSTEYFSASIDEFHEAFMAMRKAAHEAEEEMREEDE